MTLATARLDETIMKICQPGRGILAADESTGTIKKRFDSIHLESTEQNRRSYRNMLFTTKGLEESISGVILFEETIDQKDDTGKTFSELLTGKGIVPGIKVDMGLVLHPNFPPEKITRGLDGLEKRFAAYTDRSKGTLRFAKWRQTIDIGEGLPSQELIESSLDAMAQYAAIAQHAGYVPITEPEVLMDGAHDIRRCGEVTELALNILYAALRKHRVSLPHTLLKPNMVISGKESGHTDNPAEVAEATLRVFRHSVPPDVPGIVFLSGGQSPEHATANLDAIARRARNARDPWWLSFSYGRALQDPALKTWNGRTENSTSAQSALAKRARLNSLAQKGAYDPASEVSLTA